MLLFGNNFTVGPYSIRELQKSFLYQFSTGYNNKFASIQMLNSHTVYFTVSSWKSQSNILMTRGRTEYVMQKGICAAYGKSISSV